jgi:hypothetical protein
VPRTAGGPSCVADLSGIFVPRESVEGERAADVRHTLVEDPTVEIAIDGGLHATAQIAMGGLEALFLSQQEAVEVMGESTVEDAALGSPGAVGASVGRGATRLHSNQWRRNRRL